MATTYNAGNNYGAGAGYDEWRRTGQWPTSGQQTTQQQSQSAYANDSWGAEPDGNLDRQPDPWGGEQRESDGNPYMEPQTDRFDPNDQVDNTGVGGPQTTQSNTGNIQQTVQGILSKYGYGAAGMAAAEQELLAAGIEIQKDSAGRFRGRIKLPDGRLVDIIDPRDGGAQGDWWNNQRGTEWGWTDHGVHPEDGWSFDGGGSAQGPGLLATHGTSPGADGPADPNVDPFASIGGGVYVNGGWVPKGHPAAGGAGGGGTPGVPGGGVDTDGDGQPNDVNQELWQMLMERARQGLAVDRNDPLIRAQADAYSAQEERARRNLLGDVAESSSPYATGHQRGVERMTAEGVGQRTGAMESELMGRELTARRQEIQHALDSMAGLLTEQQRMALQRELAEMDNAIRRHQIDTQNSQFYAGLSQADRHFLQEMAQRGDFFGRDDAFRHAQLGQNQNQFLDSQAFNYWNQRNYWDNAQRNGGS